MVAYVTGSTAPTQESAPARQPASTSEKVTDIELIFKAEALHADNQQHSR